MKEIEKWLEESFPNIKTNYHSYDDVVRYLKTYAESLNLPIDSDKVVVNFCTMSDDELMKTLRFVGGDEVMEVIKKSEEEQKFKGGVCIERRWTYWHSVIVTPTEIFYQEDPYPKKSVMTADKYIKLKSF